MLRLKLENEKNLTKVSAISYVNFFNQQRKRGKKEERRRSSFFILQSSGSVCGCVAVFNVLQRPAFARCFPSCFRESEPSRRRRRKARFRRRHQRPREVLWTWWVRRYALPTGHVVLHLHVLPFALVLVVVRLHVAVPHPVASVACGVVNVSAVRVVMAVWVEVCVGAVLVGGRGRDGHHRGVVRSCNIFLAFSVRRCR